MKTKKLLLIILGMTIFVGSRAENTDSLALTPPMGWNSWNCFGPNIDEKLIREIADVMATNGMKDAGYEYINLDDGWQVSRDANGEIIADPERFPSGIKALADYIHSKGLKFGLYSCGGSKTCAGRPGSNGYQFQDARTYAKWGVDFLKYDWCDNDGQNARPAYNLMRQALNATGRPILFSICEWGQSQPWTWAKGIGHIWRTSGDIITAFEGKAYYGGEGLLNIIDRNADLWQYAGPGHWNDPDMLHVGNGFSPEENRTHFSMWCMMAAPLIAGNNLKKMDTSVLAILTNREVIAIDQDKLGKQGRRYSQIGQYEIWVKPLSGGELAVCFLNRGETVCKIDFNFSHHYFDFVGVDINRGEYKVRDLWQHKDIGDNDSGKIHFEIPGHGVVMVKLYQ